jgi:FKBP-type peptidyl-prolyl cis-trans isomerase
MLPLHSPIQKPVATMKHRLSCLSSAVTLRIVLSICVLTLSGCASPQETQKQTPVETKSSETGEQQVARDTEETDEPVETNDAETTEAKLPEKETTMADSNAPKDVASPPEDATTTDSGLAYKILEEGQGDTPSKTSTVQVHYTGWTTDGEKFDSSHDRGKPAEFPLDRVIAGWTEGVAMMKPGEKRRLWIPEALAYKGRPGSPQGMLVFDVELIKIVKK